MNSPDFRNDIFGLRAILGKANMYFEDETFEVHISLLNEDSSIFGAIIVEAQSLPYNLEQSVPGTEHSVVFENASTKRTYTIKVGNAIADGLVFHITGPLPHIDGLP